MSKFRNSAMMKRAIILLVLMVTLTGCSAGKTDQQLQDEGWVKNPAEHGWVLQSEEGSDSGSSSLGELPAPLLDENAEKPYAATNSSITVDNLDQYLNREDVVYIDIREYDAYAQKHFKNFEVIPYFGWIFNEDAHNNPDMVQLYGGSPEEPVDVYEQSDALLNAAFPKDKTLFIMCESGGRVTQMLQVLDAKGYDMDKIYNIGGIGQYTDSKYRDHITDTLEFVIDVNHSMEGMARN